MASARPASTKSQGSGSSRSSKGGSGDGGEVSAARWAGVALVITALVAAIVLAVISPSDPGGGTPSAAAVDEPTPEPTPAVPDGPVPVVAPEIIVPKDGLVTREVEVDLTVAVPQDEIPRRDLQLWIMREGERLETRVRPKVGNVSIPALRLEEGPNEIVALLRGPGGSGPTSKPVTITLDRDPPPLQVTAPKENKKTTNSTITVAGTSEVGAKIVIKNNTTGAAWEESVGPTGKFDAPIRLDLGANKIRVLATDSAGNTARRTVNVRRIDARPTVKLKVSDKTIKVSSLPENIRASVTVTDGAGDPVAGAEVVFSLVVPGGPSSVEETGTKANGRASWGVRIPRGDTRQGDGHIEVVVTTPDGETGRDSVRLSFS
jgi:hypothetical protein